MRPKSPSWRAGAYYFDSLPNAEVSELVYAGLTFWGPQTESVKSEWDSPERINGVDIGRPVPEGHATPVLDGHRSEGEGDIWEDGIDTNEQDNDSGCILI